MVRRTFGFDEGFIKNYNEKRKEGYFLEVDIQYAENLYNVHNDLLFLPERIKIKKVEKLVVVLHDKNECYSHKKFKASIKSHGLVFKNLAESLSLLKRRG